MLVGLLQFSGPANKKDIFSKKKSRDNLSDHWIEMRKFFFKNGIRLVTEDELGKSKHSFEIHIDVENAKNSKVPKFLFSWESKYLKPENANQKKLSQYYRVFSWDSNKSDLKNFTKFYFPHFRRMKLMPNGFYHRKKLVIMIANNKSLPYFDRLSYSYNLYSERVKSIRWFEKFYPDDFYLYGSGWDKSPRFPGKLGGLIHVIEEKILFKKFKFKSWRGSIKKKDDILKSSKFSIVYENLSDQNDYITEKIFDCFCFGNIPIYWGAKNILKYIPYNCFIDRRNFKSHFELFHH